MKIKLSAGPVERIPRSPSWRGYIFYLFGMRAPSAITNLNRIRVSTIRKLANT